MAYERFMGSGLDYRPCRYGTSKLTFRGPERDLADEYVAFLGSSETFGKFVRTPFPDLVGRELGVTPVNLGCVNAGVETFCDDPTVQEICRRAAVCVLQVMGAHKLSNGFYSVHGRRNDRFLAPTDRLRELYPELDFSKFHFVRHLLSVLASGGDRRFAVVRDELKKTWLAGMTRLVEACDGPVVLLWLAQRTPDENADSLDGAEPLFVDRDLIRRLGTSGTTLLEVPPSTCGRASDTDGMVFSALEEGAARELPGPGSHREIARLLLRQLSNLN